jgi:hypothetical protein
MRNAELLREDQAGSALPGPPGNQPIWRPTGARARTLGGGLRSPSPSCSPRSPLRTRRSFAHGLEAGIAHDAQGPGGPLVAVGSEVRGAVGETDHDREVEANDVAHLSRGP